MNDAIPGPTIRQPGLHTDLYHALSPAAFARDRLGFHPDPQQAAVLQAPGRQVILCCTRQWGKSTVTAARAVFTAWHQPGSLTLVLSPCARQSAELVRKAGTFAVRLGVRPRGDGDNGISLLFPNGARIVGLPGNEANIRGFSSASLMVVDEAARVHQDIFLAMLPTLAVSRGALWLISTPWGRRGFFFDTWTRAQSHQNTGHPWARFFVPATECPRISQETLEFQRQQMGDQVFRREYLCEFIDTDETLFPDDLILPAVNYELKRLF